MTVTDAAPEIEIEIGQSEANENDLLAHAFCLLCFPDHGTGKVQTALCGWIKKVSIDLGPLPPSEVCGICVAFMHEPCPLCGGRAG